MQNEEKNFGQNETSPQTDCVYAREPPRHLVMASFFRWLTGGSNLRTELYEVQVDNKAIEEHEAVVTICLQAQIEDGKRLGFRLSPKMANKTSDGLGNGGAATFNPLASIRDALRDENQRAVIRSITRLSAHNELSVDLSFELQHPFEDDVASQTIRDRVEAALKTEATRAVTVTSKAGSVVNSNHRVLDAGTEEYASRLLVESEAEDAPLSRRDGYVSATTARTKLETAHQRITLRGGEHRSNEAERENVINLGVIKALSTCSKPKQVYRASLSDNSIKWFAGQDHVVAEKSNASYTGPKAPPPPARPTVEGSVASRAEAPVEHYDIIDADSALVTFIKRFCDDMPGIHSRMEPLLVNKADDQVRYYKVDKKLVHEAKEKILYTVYAQMYYTRLPNCLIARRVESEHGEEGIAIKVAGDWHLAVDPKTKCISDWSADAYRPVVVITLRILYTAVHGVSATAASFFRSQTRLVPVAAGGL